MTADERIEKLLNRFGQTISNLPKPENKKYSYGWYTMQHLDKAAREWGKKMPILTGPLLLIMHVISVT